MTRISREEITNFFMWLCRDLGKQICLSIDEVKALKKWGRETWIAACPIVPYGTLDAWMLDYNSAYGGWQIQQVETTGGGISMPMGHRRFKSEQFLAMICFARDALRIKQMENQQ